MIPGIFICSLFAHQAQIDLDTGGSRVIIWSHVVAVGVEFDGVLVVFFFLFSDFSTVPSLVVVQQPEVYGFSDP